MELQIVDCPAEGSMPLKLQGVEWVRKVWSLYLPPLSPSVIHSCTLSCLLLFLSPYFFFLSFISFPSGAPSLSALLKLCTQTDRQTDGRHHTGRPTIWSVSWVVSPGAVFPLHTAAKTITLPPSNLRPVFSLPPLLAPFSSLIRLPLPPPPTPTRSPPLFLSSLVTSK